MSNRKQVALLHIAKDRLGLDDATYRQILRRVAGVESAAAVDARAFRELMDYFASLGFRSSWRERNLGDRPGMASPGQVALIRSLWRDYAEADELALGRWLQRSYGVGALRFLDSPTASKAIAGLRAMVRRKRTQKVA